MRWAKKSRRRRPLGRGASPVHHANRFDLKIAGGVKRGGFPRVRFWGCGWLKVAALQQVSGKRRKSLIVVTGVGGFPRWWRASAGEAGFRARQYGSPECGQAGVRGPRRSCGWPRCSDFDSACDPTVTSGACALNAAKWTGRLLGGNGTYRGQPALLAPITSAKARDPATT
jgi:hypothetical protein